MQSHVNSLCLLFLFLVLVVPNALSQSAQGKVIVTHINATSLKNNAGENPDRRVTIYLPPGYDQTTNRYPVIYYLHGYTWSDSLLVASDHINQVLDKGIKTGKIRPVIVVMPNERTLYGGSFYTNSSLAGSWADFTAKELVSYIDAHYRTIAKWEGRAVSGHSMGGHGALKLAMQFPGVFSSVYAFSPGVLDFDHEELGPKNDDYRNIQQADLDYDRTHKAIVRENIFVALARAYSPNPSNPPFYADLPYTFSNDSVIVNHRVIELWKKNSPFYMVDAYADSLRKLKAIKFDWGRNDEFKHIPPTCLAFSKKLERLHINHYAEEYIGTHGSKILSDDGRMLNEMLPFFNTYLNFEPIVAKKELRGK